PILRPPPSTLFPTRRSSDLVLDLLARQSGQAREPHLEDRLRLDLAQRELLHQAGPRHVPVRGRADQRDDRVDVVERDQIALEDRSEEHTSELQSLAYLVCRL